jgi:hypothetical protein
MEQCGYNRIGYSSTCVDKRTIGIRLAALSAGISVLNVAGINASAIVTLLRDSQVTARIDRYEDMLRTAKEKSIVMPKVVKEEERG